MTIGSSFRFSSFAGLALAGLSLTGPSLTACKKDATSGTGGDGGTAASISAPGAGVAATSSHFEGFEGAIDVKVSGDPAKFPQPVTLPLSIKGQQVRIDIPEGLVDKKKGKSFAVIDGATKKATYAIESEKSGFTIDIGKMGDMVRGMAHGAPGAPGSPAAQAANHAPPKVTKTGKTETVAGMTCEDWNIENTETHDKVDVCVANEGFSWFTFPSGDLPPQAAGLGELLDGKHFPLKATETTGGKVAMAVEVVKLDKKTLDPSVFVVPADYKLMDLNAMMAGLQNAGGMPAGMKPPAGGRGLPGKKP